MSSDYRGNPRSSIIDGLSTLVIGGKLVKILAWYDNEWAFSNRLVELAHSDGKAFQPPGMKGMIVDS